MLYAFLRDTGWLAELAGATTVAAEEQLANVGRFFDIVRTQSALLADDRAVFLARHLATLIEAGDDPPTADPDPDVDAVHVMTVHKAKGLEFPIVFLPGLVADRFPARSRREPLALPIELVDEVLPEGDGHLQEERRLFYVAMTRARDELILSHASESAGGRARRLSPFVVEALDLPTAGFQGEAFPSSTHATGPLARIAAAEPRTDAPEADRLPVEGPLTLSHSAIDDYLSCPLRYKYAQVVRVPTTPHHSMIYGSALHKAVQEFHRSQSRGKPSPRRSCSPCSTRRGPTRASSRVSTRRRDSRRVAARCAASANRSSSRAPSSRRGSSASSRSRWAATGFAGASTAWTSCPSPRRRHRSRAPSSRTACPRSSAPT